jgi:hypothetical protein
MGNNKLFPKIIIYLEVGKVEFLNEISKLILPDWGSCMQREITYDPLQEKVNIL